MDDLETSDESDSEELSLSGAENARSRFNPGPRGQSPSTLASSRARSHSEAESSGVPLGRALHSNRVSSSSASTRPSIMRLGNHSTPQLSPSSSFFLSAQEPLPQYMYDPKKPIGNVVDSQGRPSFSSTRSAFGKRGKGKGIGQGIGPNSPLLPIGAASSSLLGPGVPPGRVSESSVHSGALLEVSGPGVGPRPRSAGSATGKKVQRESILRFDGMLVQHLAAEKDRMKRITHDYASSATNSPVQPPSGPSSSVAGQMPFSAAQ